MQGEACGRVVAAPALRSAQIVTLFGPTAKLQVSGSAALSALFEGGTEAAPRRWPRSERGGLWAAVRASGEADHVASSGGAGEASPGAPGSAQHAL